MTATTLLRRVRRVEGRPARSRSLRPWYRNGTLMTGLVIVGLLVLVAILAPVLAPYDPVKQDLPSALLAPSSEHWLGTDKYGRDIFSRLLWGARVDLRIGVLAVLIPFVFGSVMGALAGYFGGWFDVVVMRVVDVFFAFPFYILVIALVFVLGAGRRASTSPSRSSRGAPTRRSCAASCSWPSSRTGSSRPGSAGSRTRGSCCGTSPPTSWPRPSSTR